MELELFTLTELQVWYPKTNRGMTIMYVDDTSVLKVGMYLEELSCWYG